MPDEMAVFEPVPELVTAIRAGQVVPLVGAGLAHAAGLPDWSELLRGVCDEAWRRCPGRRSDLLTAWQAIDGRPLDATDVLRTVLGPDFNDLLAEQYSARRTFAACDVAARSDSPPWRLVGRIVPVDPQPTPTHRMLVRLGLPYLLTTAHDGLLEAAADVCPPTFDWSAEELPARLAEDRTTTTRLIKLLGDLRRPHDLIAARVDLAWPADPVISCAIRMALTDRTPLWIGFRPFAPDLELALDIARSLGLAGGHALIPDSSLHSRLGASPVTVAPLREGDITAALQALALACGRPASLALELATPCVDARKMRRKASELEDLLQNFGVQATIWGARAGAARWGVEAEPPDFRSLQALLHRRDGDFLDRLAAHDVRRCDDIPCARTIAAPVRSAAPTRSEPTYPEPTPQPRSEPTAIYVPVGPPASALAALLVLLFNHDELRQWLARRHPEVASHVQLAGALATATLDVAEALAYRGLLTGELLDTLREVRPHRGHDIDALAHHLFPVDPGNDEPWESYSLFCRLLDRDAAWNRLARACNEKDGPVVFLLHGQPQQCISLFMDRVHRYLDDVDKDGVKREHRVFEVLFERDFRRLRTAEEWEASFRTAMGFNKKKPLLDYLRPQLAEHATIFIVRGQGNTALSEFDQDERDALVGFLRERLAAVFRGLKPPHRAVRVLVGIEHRTPTPEGNPLFDALDAALDDDLAVEHERLSVRFPTLEETLESVDRFLSQRVRGYRRLSSALRAQCEAVHQRHEARGTDRNYRDLADDLYRALGPLLSAPSA